MSKIKNIIFDFDGTLVDTAPLIVATMQATIRELNLPAKSDEECRATIGLRLEEIPAVLWPEIDGLSQVFASTYRRIFDELKRPLGVSCFPGVLTTLRQLHNEGYRMAIASSRSHKSLDEYIGNFDLRDMFTAVVGGNDVTHGKPSPEPVEVICNAAGWAADETIVVGDTTFDILMGRNAGTRTCGVTYGNQTREELSTASPDSIIDEFPTLASVIATMK